MNQAISQSVLILAQDLLTSTLLKMLLKPAGFRVETVVNPTNPLNEVEARRPDIVLIDAQSLNDGLSMSREIRDYADKESLPIVLLSNCTHTRANKESHDAGINTHLYKPVSRHELVNQIQLAAAHQFAFV